MKKLFSHPLMQTLSFCILLVGSSYFGGPYGYFVLFGFLDLQFFAIMGMIGIVVTLISMMVRSRVYMQAAGLLLMLLSLAVFFFSSRGVQSASTMTQVLPLITLALFVSVTVCVGVRVLKQ